MAWLKGPRKDGYVTINENVDFRGSIISRGGANYIPKRTDVYYVDGQDGSDNLDGKTPNTAVLTIEDAVDKAGNDDRIYIASNLGSSYELADTVTWSYNGGAIIGNALTPMQPYLDITMAYGSGFDPMFTVSGRGNVFANLTLRHGAPTTSGGQTGNVGDLTCMTISGRYNYFENVYFMTPMYAIQDVASTYKGVQVTGHGNYFRYCKFGSDGLERDKANYNLEVAGGIGNVFEDCLFQMKNANTSPLFVNIDPTANDMKHTLFKNCTFYAHDDSFTYAPAYAFHVKHEANTVGVIIENCDFVNVGGVTDAASDIYLWKHTAGDTAASTATGIAENEKGA